MDDPFQPLLKARDHGRSDTRKMLDAGEMSDGYARNLVKGSFGLGFWLAIFVSVLFVVVRHWPVWKVGLIFIPVWLVGGFLIGAAQSLLIGLIFALRKSRG